MQKPKFKTWFCKGRKCAESSSNTAYYNLKKIRSLVGIKNPGLIPKTAAWFKESMLTELEKLRNVTRKNLATSLVSYLRLTAPKSAKTEKASQAMLRYAAKQDLFYKSQEKTERQKKNWITFDELKQFYKEKQQEVKLKKIYKKAKWLPKDRKLAQEELMLALSGVKQPPVRLEMSSLTYVTTEPTSDFPKGNYLFQKRNQWVALVQQSKISSKKGDQRFTFEPSLARILNKLKRYLKNGDPVFQGKGNRMMSRNSFGKRLQGLFLERFGKRVGSQLLRAIYLSHKYKNMPSIEDMEKTSQQMLHTTKTALGKYVKR